MAVGPLRSLRVTGRHEDVQVVVEDRVDVREVDERFDVDRAGLARGHRCELLIGEDDLLAVEVVPVPARRQRRP
jgi:hypothetical protein